MFIQYIKTGIKRMLSMLCCSWIYLLVKLVFNGWIGRINPFSLNSQNPGCCMSNKAAAACPIRMTQTHRVEDFQENVRPASNLNWLDEFQQLFTDGCQLSPSPTVMHWLPKVACFFVEKRKESLTMPAWNHLWSDSTLQNCCNEALLTHWTVVK